MDILFRTFLDILLLQTPFNALRSFNLFAIFLTLNLLSKILRGHIVPHFLSYSLLSLLCLYVFTSLYSESYPRLCVGILLRTFLDSLSSYILLTSFLASYILKFYPLTSFFDFVFLFYPSSSLYLRFCVSILFRTFLRFWNFSLFLLFRSLSSVLLRFFFLCKLLRFCVGIFLRTFLDSTFHLSLQFPSVLLLTLSSLC